MTRWPMDAFRVEPREHCDGCEDIGDDGNDVSYAAAELAIGPMGTRRRVQLCAQCLVRLRELVTFALAKYTDIPTTEVRR